MPQEPIKPLRKRYARHDWPTVQRYYDDGHSRQECLLHFGIGSSLWSQAERRGDIVPDPSKMLPRREKNLEGKRFGRLTVLEEVPVPEGKSRARYWKCLCECGGERIVKTKRLHAGLATHCGCVPVQWTKKRGRGFAATLCGEISKTFWGRVIRNASTNRSIPFHLTIEQGWDLFVKQQRKCAVSGVDLVFDHKCPSNTTASLDRIDSKLPYTVDNVQWVHKWVNTMKWDFTMDEFLEWNRVIYHHQSSLHVGDSR